MRFNIQRFATWEELTDYYNQNLNQTQAKINELQAQKEADISGYETNYQNQLNEYKDLQAQQQNYIDAWAANQKEQQQKQTDFNIGLIEQNKKEAAEAKQKEVKDAYTDYMKQTNQYGGALENLASRGLATQGYAESSKVAMYNTYQNRVATANEALTKANVQYDNQIQQALLNNDAALAETALEQMKQTYQLALSGFEYTSNLYNQKISYLQNIEDIYFDRENTLRGLAGDYASQLSAINQYREQMAEEQRQFNAQMNYKYSGGSGGSGGSSGGYSYSSGSSASTSTNYGNSSTTQGKSDYYFKNGYQPQYINDIKLSNSEGWEAAQILTPNECASLGVKQTQNVWKAGDRYYLWIGSAKSYVDVTDEIKTAKSNNMKPGMMSKVGTSGTGTSGGVSTAAIQKAVSSVQFPNAKNLVSTTKSSSKKSSNIIKNAFSIV